LLTVGGKEGVRRDDESAGAKFAQPCRHGVEVSIAIGVEHIEPHSQRACRSLQVSQFESAVGLVGLRRTAITVAVGTASCKISNRFGVTCTFKLVTPVMLPPGRFSVCTNPVAMGSAPISNTMGIVVVTDFAASAAGAPPGATITATRWSTNSAANSGSLLCWLSAQRNSIVTFRPSTYPASPRPWRKALTRLANAAGDSHQGIQSPASPAVALAHVSPRPRTTDQRRRQQ
jgi:hypothetical protein